MRSASGLVLVGALGLGGGAVYLTRGYIESRLLNPQPVVQTRTIVVANQPLSFGVALTGDNLVEIPWPADTDLDGTFTKKEDLLKEGKRVVLTAIQKNEPILATKVTDPNQKATLSVLIDEKMRAVTVRVDDVRGVAGFVTPNDRVDVVLTRGDQERQSAEILLQNVKVWPSIRSRESVRIRHCRQSCYARSRYPAVAEGHSGSAGRQAGADPP